MSAAYWLIVGAWVGARGGWPSVWVVAATVTVLEVAKHFGGLDAAYRLGVWTRDMIGGAM